MQGTIEFLPVCSNCHKVIYAEIKCDRYEEHPELYANTLRFMPNIDISPRVCPECGVQFDTITMPLSLPFDNTIELKSMTSEDILDY